MIIGKGLLAKTLERNDSEELLIFASGVSNSLETNPLEFQREINLLEEKLAENPNKKLIYFSSCSIHDPSKSDSLYVLHKLRIEKLISRTCSSYLIMRVGNAVGKGGNPTTLINYLKNAIENNNKITLYNKAKRILVGVDDIAIFINENKNNINNQIINFAYPYQFSLKEILIPLEKHLGKKANYTEVDEGSYYDIVFEKYINFYFKNTRPEEYLEKLYQAYV